MKFSLTLKDLAAFTGANHRAVHRWTIDHGLPFTESPLPGGTKRRVIQVDLFDFLEWASCHQHARLLVKEEECRKVVDVFIKAKLFDCSRNTFLDSNLRDHPND